MRILSGRVVFTGATVLGLLACSASSSNSALEGIAGGAFASTCTEDAGVLTPIGPQGCHANQTVVYRRPLAGGGGASGITSASGTSKTPIPAMVTACTDTKCRPGQVAVVTFQPSGSSGPFSTDSGLDGAVRAVDAGGRLTPDGAVAEGGRIPPRDGGVTLARDGGAADAVADGGRISPQDAAADGGPIPPSDAAAPPPDASPVAATDASDGATTSSGDGGGVGIPCNAVISCVTPPPTCPDGQSPSYAPSGRWHCMPLCDSNREDTVVITYGATYGNTTICASSPPTSACPDQGAVWTWNFEEEEWICAPECDNGQYDQHVYNGQTVCVPC